MRIGHQGIREWKVRFRNEAARSAALPGGGKQSGDGSSAWLPSH